MTGLDEVIQPQVLIQFLLCYVFYVLTVIGFPKVYIFNVHCIPNQISGICIDGNVFPVNESIPNSSLVCFCV